ncbi:MAG TPA: right-handed parallel beta-helix repeat-containing protein [Chthoniobacteraceae bacterium]|jgi:hypothetical protein|nr:right-handed parallel beta-helix repeat-containing protein [Chthoniobacteraceae bacterium]
MNAPSNLSRLVQTRLAVLLSVLLCGAITASAGLNVLESGLKGDGVKDDGPALQKLLAGGATDLDFPGGTYLLGTIELPAETHLSFSAKARVKVSPAGVQEVADEEDPRMPIRPLFMLKGDRITVEGLNADGVFAAEGKDARGRARRALNQLIFGEGTAGFTCRNLRVVMDEAADKRNPPSVVVLRACRDVELTGSHFENIGHALLTERCRNVSVHGNHAEFCNTITTFAHGESLRHYDNWSRRVVYQCVFRGGSPDPSRKAPTVPLGSSSTVVRGLAPGQDGYSRHLAGTYDIQVTNNYAEYGRTLAWGNKAREVIFQGNICRFTTDYAYGVEGCENVTFANNIAINAKSVGIMTMYWGGKVTITGNTVIVRDEPYEQKYSQETEQKKYWGGLLRFHHGPTTKEDTAAGSDYGAGRVIVTGNLLINELHDQVRGISIESGRDVFLSGNRVVNGWVRKTGDGEVTIMGNEFTSDLAQPHTIIGLHGASGEAVIKDNVLRYAPGKFAFEGARVVKAGDGGEAEAAVKEETLAAALPAIVSGGGAGKSLAQLIIQGNTIQGWTADAIALEAAKHEGEPYRYLVRGNTLDGAIRLTGLPDSYRSVVTDNLGRTTLAPVVPVMVAQEPAGK